MDAVSELEGSELPQGQSVEDQEIDFALHQHAELQAAFFAAGENTDFFQHVGGLEAKAREKAPGFFVG